MNKQIGKKFGMAVRTVSYLRPYCSMFQIFETFRTSDEHMNSDRWCVKCAKYLTFGTFETADDSALKH